MKIGIVAIQGDYEAHAKALDRLGAAHTYVRRPEDLAGLAGIILPGGESTTHLKVMKEEGLFAALKQFAANGGAFFGTCAGAILLARDVHGPAQDSLGLLDVSILRNGYGRQLASHIQRGATKLREEPLEMVFIRAPIIESVGKGVDDARRIRRPRRARSAGTHPRVHISSRTNRRHNRPRAFPEIAAQ